MKAVRWFVCLAFLLALASPVPAADATPAPAGDKTPAPAVAVAGPATRESCLQLMTAADDAVATGAALKTRGQIYGDSGMIAEGVAAMARGEKMLEAAKNSDPLCKRVIEEAQKEKQKPVTIMTDSNPKPATKDEPHR